MSQQTRRQVIVSLVVTLIIIVPAMDFLLWHLDPSGVVAQVYDLNTLAVAGTRQTTDGYRFTPGYYDMKRYDVTITGEGFRDVPTSQGGDCHIAFVGDSVTFGMGSNITFADLLAPDIAATVTNAGMPGYGAANIAKVVDTVEADGYIWLIFDNDAYEMSFFDGIIVPRWQTAFELYQGVPYGETIDEAETRQSESAFVRDAAGVLERSDVLPFAFEGGAIETIVARRYPQVHLIPRYTSLSSHYDGHPSETGHAQVAAAMRDDVITFADKICEG